MSTSYSSNKLDSLHLSESLNNEYSVSPRHETLLKIPSTIAQFPLGFALDAGGSVIKVVYRSKLDYTSGQPNNKEHMVRLRYLPNGDNEKLIKFINENCDVRVPSPAANDIANGDGKRPLYYQTGVGMQHMAKALEEAFQCKIKAMPEMDACFDIVYKLPEFMPELKQTTPFSVESTKAALRVASDFISMRMNNQQEEVNTFGEKLPALSREDVRSFCAKVLTTNPTSFVEELNGLQIKYPYVYIQCGSTTVSYVLHENGRKDMGDIQRAAGKTILALARLTLKIKSFRELLDLASQGDYRKVDLMAGDLKNVIHDDTDWYSKMPDSFPVYMLGKAADNSYDGTYSRADLAAALVYMQCRELAHFGINVARRSNLTSVVYSGSFVNWPLTHHILQECFLSETLLQQVMGEAQTTMHIHPHCGFLTALGVWYENTKTTDTK